MAGAPSPSRPSGSPMTSSPPSKRNGAPGGRSAIRQCRPPASSFPLDRLGGLLQYRHEREGRLLGSEGRRGNPVPRAADQLKATVGREVSDADEAAGPGDSAGMDRRVT